MLPLFSRRTYERFWRGVVVVVSLAWDRRFEVVWMMGDVLGRRELCRSAVYSRRMFLLFVRRWCAMSDCPRLALFPLLACHGPRTLSCFVICACCCLSMWFSYLQDAVHAEHVLDVLPGPPEAREPAERC